MKLTDNQKAYRQFMVECSEEDFILNYQTAMTFFHNMPYHTRSEHEARIDQQIFLKDILRERLRSAYQMGYGGWVSDEDRHRWEASRKVVPIKRTSK